MKKIVTLFTLLAILFINTQGISATADAVNKLNKSVVLQPRIVKKQKRHTKKHISPRHNKRTQMQLKQANKHLKEDKKVQRAESKLKKEQPRSN